MLNNNHIIKTLSNTILSLSLVCLIFNGININATKEIQINNMEEVRPEPKSPREHVNIVPHYPGPPYK